MTTLVKYQKIYDEFIDLIAQGTTPESVTKFQFSETTKELKRLVSKRDDYLCEYCLISEEDSAGCQVDRIISLKHGGETTAENLAYACLYCNLNKGTDLGSIIWRTGELVRFFNPRRDRHSEHFRIEGATI